MKARTLPWWISAGLLVADASAAPVAGGWESFPTSTNANAWAVYDYPAAAFYFPGWTSSGGSYIFRQMSKNPSGPSGVWFFGDSSVASGALAGDYAAQGIRGLKVRYFIDPTLVREMDCSIRANGPNGVGEYLSESILGDDLEGFAEWREAEFLFNTTWYYVIDGVFYATPVTPGMLASIERIGFRFVPRDSNTTSALVGIDDVVLIPTVTAPVLVPGTSGANFTLAFTPSPGTACTIETPQAGDWSDWVPVPGKENLTGPQVFQTPMAPGKGFFRVEAGEHLTPLVTP